MKVDTQIYAVPTLIIGAMCVSLSFLAGGLAGGCEGRSECRRDAVRTGCAQWIAGDEGQPTFEWTCNEKEQP